jgi:aryl-alcohol dehydrogenase-like predicted oxidoreductase
MRRVNLPGTDTNVSKIMLGTMNFGTRTDEAEAFAIMDRALELGVDFFDTAEMYPVPPSAATYGASESIVGRWMAARGTRDRVTLATKVVGPSGGTQSGGYIRDGFPRLDRANIRAAIDKSLERLDTDHVELYQLHWPDRVVNKFGQRAFVPPVEERSVAIADTLDALAELLREGKIRHYGLSNETPWGTMEFLRIAREKGMPAPVTVQNNYSLLTRTYEVAMAEITYREGIGLLGYSPMAYGVLAGRYLDGKRPEDGRFTKFPNSTAAPRYTAPRVENIVKKYIALAERHGMSPATLAQAFAYSRWFMTSAIIGPGTVAQLEESVRALDTTLSPEILAEIDAIHEECPNPCA